MRAHLLPGRTYYVEVSSGLGFWRPSVSLLPIAPRTESWADRDRWLAESEGYRTVHASEDWDENEVRSFVASCKATWPTIRPRSAGVERWRRTTEPDPNYSRASERRSFAVIAAAVDWLRVPRTRSARRRFRTP